jgi:hypothetical protein
VLDSLEVLRRQVRFVSAKEALAVAAGVSRLHRPGSATVVALDDDRRLMDLCVVEDGAGHESQLVELIGLSEKPGVCSLFLVTDRTGEVPADRPDDELLWMELVELAATDGLILRDWYIVSGTFAFSVAEFAPRPAQW